MIYELLDELKSRIETNTDFKAVVVPKLPAYYELNTAYIIMPNDYMAEFCISSDSMANFSVHVYFVTYDCEADRLDKLSKDVKVGLEGIEAIIRSCMGRFMRSYADNDMEANCHRYGLNVASWQTAGKVPIAVRMVLYWKAIMSVE